MSWAICVEYVTSSVLAATVKMPTTPGGTSQRTALVFTYTARVQCHAPRDVLRSGGTPKAHHR